VTKRSATLDRPQRRATVISNPEELSQVSVDLPKALESECPNQGKLTPANSLDVVAYLEKGILPKGIRRPRPSTGRRSHYFDEGDESDSEDVDQ
jgi:hypothetical protein